MQNQFIVSRNLEKQIRNWTLSIPITYRTFTKKELPKLVGLEGPITAVSSCNENELRLFDTEGRESNLRLLNREDDDFDLAHLLSSTETFYYKIINNSKLLLKMEERIFLASIVERIYFLEHNLEIQLHIPIPSANAQWIRVNINLVSKYYTLYRKHLESEILAMLYEHAYSQNPEDVYGLYKKISSSFINLGEAPSSLQISYEENLKQKNLLLSAQGKVLRYKMTDSSGCYVRTDNGNWSFSDSEEKVALNFEEATQTFSFKISKMRGEEINSVNLGEITDKALHKIYSDVLPVFKSNIAKKH